MYTDSFLQAQSLADPCELSVLIGWTSSLRLGFTKLLDPGVVGLFWERFWELLWSSFLGGVSGVPRAAHFGLLGEGSLECPWSFFDHDSWSNSDHDSWSDSDHEKIQKRFFPLVRANFFFGHLEKGVVEKRPQGH